MLAEIRQLGFDHVELGHATRLSLVDGIQRAVGAGEAKVVSLHNFCPLPLGLNGPAPDYYLPSSRRSRERELAVRHTLRTVDFAASLGARAVVLHLGLVPMRNRTFPLIDLFAKGQAGTSKFERKRLKTLKVRERRRQKYFDNVCGVLDQVVPRAKSVGVKLGLETRLGIEQIPTEDEVGELIARFGTDAVGYWFDVAHAQIKENLGFLQIEAVLERFRGQTLGMHLQDFAPPVFDHLAPGEGQFDFLRLQPFVTDDMILAWELHGPWEAPKLIEGTRRVQQLLRPTNAA